MLCLCVQGTTTVTGEYANPKVADLDLEPHPSVVADGVSTSILAPLCILHRSTAGQLASSGRHAGWWMGMLGDEWRHAGWWMEACWV